ncbi:semaphorin-1A-like [Cimex lectularius]|uniref:Semaphorin-1A n=1 Tax=Cimex lectularius TaxID=79782 RepID=A0A8I6SK52_CIMLE|nr:semaphorin-1A-like [Cimex lectularius]XP_024082699.1 semaphorin-1A-like [Cimex lectularius]
MAMNLMLACFCVCVPYVFSWVQNLDPRMYTTYNENQIHKFKGNDSFTDFFKLLETDYHSVLIGSRNAVYNISIENLLENTKQRIVWNPTGAHRELCYLKGKTEEDCQNYIRVGAKLDEDHFLICGTNAYKPLCRHYKLSENVMKVVNESEGHGWCPYDPNHNSTALYTDGHVYTATVVDFGGVESFIYRDPLSTERSDLKQLNDASFVSSMSYQDYVFFFFREAAVEYINCGKVIYSRVGRVCKKDKGAPHLFGNRWTSFTKARLNCSIPGDYPFYFNEIQSTSDIIEGVYGSKQVKLIYGVFTTPINSIGGSAICAFSVDSIMETFNGPFKEQESMNSNWLRVSPSRVPVPRPGQCVNDSRTLPDVSVNFVKTHPLMDQAVPSFAEPLLVRISLRNRFTAITVDPQVKTITGEPMDVLYIGTDDGKIIKAVNYIKKSKPEESKAFFTEEIQINGINSAIKSLSITRVPDKPPKLLIITNDVVHTIPLYRCTNINSCRECVAIQDPYCAWDSLSNSCVAHGEFAGNKKNFLQNIERGSHISCQPPGQVKTGIAASPAEKEVTEEGRNIDLFNCPKCSICNPSPCAGENGIGGQEKIVIYTADTLGMVVTTSVLATLVIGFVAGYFCSRHFRPDNAYTNMPLHQHNSNMNGEGASYLSPCVNNKSINLLVNVPPKNANDKIANTTSDNNKTLQKVKKTYI